MVPAAVVAVVVVLLAAGFVALSRIIVGTDSAPLPIVDIAEGTAYTDAGLTLTVMKTSQQRSVEPDYRSGPWLIVRMRVSAAGDKPALFDPMFQQLFIDGLEYQPEVTAAEEVDDHAASSASLTPGSQADVALAYPAYGAGSLAGAHIQLAVRGALNSEGAMVNLTLSSP